MTEADAKKLQCCGPEDCGIGVANAAGVYVRLCVASGCMAWRNGSETKQTGQFDNSPAADGWVDDGLENVGAGPYRVWRRPTGYCGLAGKP